MRDYTLPQKLGAARRLMVVDSAEELHDLA
jgi:hypothetical protein